MRFNTARAARVALILLVAAGASAAAQALTPDGDTGEEDSHSWGLGVAGTAMQKPYADVGRDYMPIPVIYFENRWIQLIGTTLEFKLQSSSWGEEHVLSFGARVEYDGSGYKQSESPHLNGMGERKSGILAGGAVKWDSRLLSVSAEAMFDATSHSKGRRFSIGLERTFLVGERVMITPGVTVIQMDRRYANYYFGVLPGEARADREVYLPGSTWSASLGVQTEYLWGDHHALILQAEYTALGNEIKGSPLTDRAGESMLLMGYMYRF